MEKRIITTDVMDEDLRIEGSLRPQSLKDYIGQEKAKKNLKVYIEAAKQRGDALDHVLFYGPPGLGKTTLAGIIANEMGVHLKVTSGPAIEKPGEMAAILNNLQEGDVLFVDEIHRLNRQVEEVLYPAMEDYAIDILIGKGASARSVRLDLPKFTLVGATTRAGLLTAPLRDRFGVIQHLEFYTEQELKTIIQHSAKVLEVEIDERGAAEMARRSRGTPRLANRLLKRVRDFAQIKTVRLRRKRLISRWICSRWTAMGWMSQTAGCCGRSWKSFPAARWGWIRSQRRSERMPGRLRRSVNRI